MHYFLHLCLFKSHNCFLSIFLHFATFCPWLRASSRESLLITLDSNKQQIKVVKGPEDAIWGLHGEVWYIYKLEPSLWVRRIHLAILNRDVFEIDGSDIVAWGSLPSKVVSLDGVLSNQIQLLQLLQDLFLSKIFNFTLSRSSIVYYLVYKSKEDFVRTKLEKEMSQKKIHWFKSQLRRWRGDYRWRG